MAQAQGSGGALASKWKTFGRVLSSQHLTSSLSSWEDYFLFKVVATPLHTTGTIDVAIEFYYIVEVEYWDICYYRISRLPFVAIFWISFFGYDVWIKGSRFSITCLFLNSKEPYLLFGFLLSEDYVELSYLFLAKFSSLSPFFFVEKLLISISFS